MTLAQMQSRFFEFKGKLALGQITEDEFKREIEKLRFQDSHGRWWMIGAQSGRWYYYDGTRWLLGEPPEPLGAPGATPTHEHPSAPDSARPAPIAPDAARTMPLAPTPHQDTTAQVSAPTQPYYVPPPQVSTTPLTPPRYTPPPQIFPPSTAPRVLPSAPHTLPHPHAPSEEHALDAEHAPQHTHSLGALVREEIKHVHLPAVHIPAVHVPKVHAPAPVRRFPPNVILIGAVAVGLVLVAVMWLAVDNLVPGKPISGFFANTLGIGARASPTPVARATPLPAGANNVDNFIRVGDELTAKSQFAPALTQYQNAAKVAPTNGQVLTHWARALALSGRIQDAVTTAQRATRLDPNSAAAFAEWARALAWSGQNSTAISAGEKAIQLDAENATARAFLSEAYLRAGRLTEAQNEAAAALDLDDDNVDAHRAAGWAAVVANRKAEALGEWKRVVALAPEMFFYHFEFGQVYAVYLNDAANAVPEYQKAAQLFPPYVPTYIALGRAYLAQNQPAPASLQFQKALTFDSNSSEAYVGLGLAFQKQERCSQAIPYFQKALELNAALGDAQRGLQDCGALAQGQGTPIPPPPPPAGLVAVPTAIVQATVVPLAQATPAPKTPAPGGASPAPGGSASALKGRIAFALYDGQYHLYSANADGSSRTLVAELGSGPAFSPDGAQMLYASWQKDARGIHRAEANGANDEAISLRIEDLLPSWSPDGTRYVYATRAGAGADVSKRAYVIRIADATTKPRQDPADFVQRAQYPVWGPNNKIAFRDCGFPTDTCGLAIINADGSGKTTLTSINSTAPVWSPDASKIVFMSDYGGNWDIYIINANGGSPARLTTDPAEDGLPAFSPDGKLLAFLSHRGGTWALWVMGIDGSNQRKLFDLGGDPAGTVAGNPPGQPGQVWSEQKISWR